MSITFKKKVSATTAPPPTSAARFPSGTRLNANGNLLLTSSGISSLDTFIDGGLPIGSLLLIYEDPNATLSDAILRCFLSEGIYSKQDLCVAAMRSDLTDNLPVKEEHLSAEKEQLTDTEQEKMKIAWRYENLSSLESSHHAHYDLQSTKPLPKELLDQVTIHQLTWHGYLQSQSTDSFRHYLLRSIQSLIASHYSSQQTEKRILRLGIQSLSSSLFDSDSSNHFDELFSFLYHLRILLRTSLATCVITLNEKSKLFESLADAVIELKMSNLIHTDYVGFCQLLKLPRLNTMQAFVPDTWDIGMKLLKHRRNLLFEKYSLPPDLSEDASREEKSKSFSCSSSSKELDF